MIYATTTTIINIDDLINSRKFPDNFDFIKTEKGFRFHLNTSVENTLK